MLKLTVHICLVKVSVGSSRCFKSSSWITFHYLVALILFIVLSGSFFIDVRITCCGDDCMWWLFNKYLFKYLQMLAAYCDLQWIAAIVGQYRINFFWLFLIDLYYDLNQYNWFILWFKSISVVMRHLHIAWSRRRFNVTFFVGLLQKVIFDWSHLGWGC